jgi:hypothetical protein
VEDGNADGFSLVQTDPRSRSCKRRAGAAAQLYCIAIIMSFLLNAQCLPSTTVSLGAGLASLPSLRLLRMLVGTFDGECIIYR